MSDILPTFAERAADSLNRVMLPKRRETLFEAIAHGDESHRAWLKEAIDAHFAGKPVPAPYEKSKAEQQRGDLMTLIDVLAESPSHYGGSDFHDLAHLICGDDDRRVKWDFFEMWVGFLLQSQPHDVRQDIARRLEDLIERYRK